MKREVGLASILSAAAVAGMAITAWAGPVTPRVVSGNPDCGDVAPGTRELKIEPVTSGTRSQDGQTVSVDVDGAFFDWTSTVGVDVVIVKGGPNANVYAYRPESKGDSGLSAPDNGGRPYGLSHIA